jgi:hypothetical protein
MPADQSNLYKTAVVTAATSTFHSKVGCEALAAAARLAMSHDLAAEQSKLYPLRICRLFAALLHQLLRSTVYWPAPCHCKQVLTLINHAVGCVVLFCVVQTMRDMMGLNTYTAQYVSIFD